MRNRTGNTIILIAIITLAFPGPIGAEDSLKIAYPEFYPFFSETDTGGVKGFFYDIMIEALEKRMGVPTAWIALPWKRCQENVKSGKIDAMITVPTEERAAYSDTHSDPFYLKQTKLFTYVGHKRLDGIHAIETIADIKKGGYSVITYGGNGWHEKNVSSIGVPTVEAARVRNVWRMLAAKRGDLVIEWPMGAYPDIHELGVEDRVLETDVSLEAMEFHLLISKKSEYKKILHRFNEVIKVMHADGTMGKILSAYY